MPRAAKSSAKSLPGARPAKLPDFIAPQLATLVKEAPAGEQWLHELKLDGYRMLCRIDRGKIQFWSRNGIDWTHKFPHITVAVKKLPVTSAFLDGEIIVVDEQGRSSFQKLQRLMGKGITSGFLYTVFDLPYVDGYDIRKTPLELRKELLSDLVKVAGRSVLHYSEHFTGNGEAFFKHACDYGIEGIISKLASSPYDSLRNSNWQKVKCSKEQEFVIAGFTPSKKGLPGFGSLVLGVYEQGKLIYAGRVGTGFTLKMRSDLRKQLDKFLRPSSPIAVLPKDPGLRETQWIDPKLVAQVAFAEWTDDGSIRHPSFQGLRVDKNPKEVSRETAKEVTRTRK